MTAYCDFTKGSERYAVVQRYAADPLPLAFGEVAEYRRPSRWLPLLKMTVSFAIFFAVLIGVCAGIWSIHG